MSRGLLYRKIDVGVGVVVGTVGTYLSIVWGWSPLEATVGITVGAIVAILFTIATESDVPESEEADR